MPNGDDKTHRIKLEAGSLLILHPDGPTDGFPMVVPVDFVEQGTYWFLGSIEPLRQGQSLIVECPIPGDARYATCASIVACSPSTFGLRIEPEWERVQQRAFVRVTADGCQVRVVRLAMPSAEEEEEDGVVDDVFDLVDVSAGGIRFASDADFGVGEDVVCHFELPGSLCFVLPGRIVRSPETPSATPGKPSTAVEFVGLDETNRSQLLRWVYREQVRRHREEARLEEKARERDARQSKR
jgi:hypothetical protein